MSCSVTQVSNGGPAKPITSGHGAQFNIGWFIFVLGDAHFLILILGYSQRHRRFLSFLSKQAKGFTPIVTEKVLSPDWELKRWFQMSHHVIRSLKDSQTVCNHLE
jgi:hypothetical protein